MISCAAAEDAKKVFKNEKVKTTDEFLVKKKQPLELPPDYSNIPKPNSLEEKNSKKNLEKKALKKYSKQMKIQVKVQAKAQLQSNL